MSKKIFDIIKSDLADLETALQEAVKSPVDTITDIGNHLVKAGGKRLRPAMFFLAARCSANFNLERVMPLAVALELIHMASLVHDDVLDSAATRRGEETANAKWGNQLAILAGDYLFAKAFVLVTENGYGERVNNQLSRLLADLSAGELIQNKEIYRASCDIEEYYERIAMKTANFLAISCQLGGHVMGLPEKEVQALYDYGYCVGMAFQLTDDLLDLTGDSKTIGKPAGNDILQGIITLPAIRALETSPDREELLSIVTNRHMTKADLDRALELVRATDGIEFTRKKVEEYLDRARGVLPETIPEDVRTAYVMAADFVAGRKF
ncbi:polyprenyl synthetase family protein [uncultured Anaerovibrio sp.]|uniref:polyprenyl synthetase family protein n=1 Tax=uncultured Anaerovibrio sp. TaxID=361586 RepID=UPI0026138EAA|nr:polyprenyl synthetase family protein [uncultured Anaerovibrio sp.]